MANAVRALTTRGYASARWSRLNSDWRTYLTSADEEIFRDLRQLRARSRSLLRDDDYFKHYVRKLKNNVIGHEGMTMKVEAQLVSLPSTQGSTHGNAKNQKDRQLNRAVEAAFAKWKKKEFASASGKLSFCDIERLAVESLAVDGEFIFKIIYSPNGFGMSLQQIDPDWLWEHYNETRIENGNRVVMSIEMDQYDRPVAYHFTPPRHSYYGVVRDIAGLAPDAKRVRVDAADIIHGFISLRPGQTRGVPMGHTVLARIKDLNRYENAEVINASVSAAKMGFIAPDKDSPDLDLNADGSKKDLKILDKVEPGTIQKLPRGWTFQAFDPKQPTSVFAAFCKQILRGIAAGLGISYNSLANDLEGVNYSSLRQGALDERDEWKALQHFMIEHFHEAVYAAWLFVAIGSPFLQIPRTVVDRISDPTFRPRGWAWVDPQKDADANSVELAAGTATYTEVLAEKGQDFEETMERIKFERDYINDLGLTFVYGSGRQNSQETGDQVEAQGTGSGGTGTGQGSGTNTTK